jgi:SAM-dependent methyltransferase
MTSPYFGIFQQLIESGAAEETLPYSSEEARLYDVLQAHSCDLRFYVEFCKQHPGPILEIGAGTGRLMLELAHLGFPLTAVEREADMIARFKEKELPAHLTILQADVMQCKLPPNQKVVLLSLNLLHHFVGRDSKLELLRHLQNACAADGYLIVDADKPQCFSSTSGETYAMVAETIDSEDPILYVTQSFFDEASGIDYNNSLKIPLGKRLGEMPTVTGWQWQPEPDMESLLKEAGWEIEESYGGYDREALSEESTARIYICRPLRR